MGYFLAGSMAAASQQFGTTQTDVFAVNQNGQLTVSWVGSEGPWQGPVAIGPVDHAPPGAYLAVSQQIGADQTDVFLIDNAGQLNVFWVESSGAWNGPQKIGPVGFASAGGPLVASQQFGIEQTDVFLIDVTGQLQVFWVAAEGTWNGPQKIGPVGIASAGSFIAVSQRAGLSQTDLFLVDKNGLLNIFWMSGGGIWNGPDEIGLTGNAAPGSFIAVSQQFGTGQTDVFLVDKNGQLNVFSVTGEGRWRRDVIGAPGFAAPGSPIAVSWQFYANQTDVFVVDKTGQLNVFWTIGAGIWNGPVKIGGPGITASGAFLAASRQVGADQTDLFLIDTAGRLNIFWAIGEDQWNGPVIRLDPVPAPDAGLGSNSNYLLVNDCNALTDVAVSILVTEDIVFASTSGVVTGFGFQLNAYSPLDQKCAWQQYIIAVIENEIVGGIDNWPLSGPQLANDFFNLAPVPTGRIPAGYQLKISLQNDASGNIIGANYEVIDEYGTAQANTSISLTSLAGVTTADLSPIIAFQLNLVGPANNESVVLSSGAGMITYESSSQLTAVNTEPPCAESGYVTAETANTVYGVLSASPSAIILQPFSVTADETQMIRKVGKLRPILSISEILRH
jgi:hypothetical protein